MSLVCALSGEVPEDPVISRVSGGIFERRLIEKYIAEFGKDPLNDDLLGANDLVPVRASKTVRPRPPSATSIPNLLKLLQDEWDALMLETFKLKQHYDQTQKELANALYQQDAAVRVIARLTRERDAARQALASASVSAAANGSAASASGPAAMEIDDRSGASAPASASAEGALPAQVQTVMKSVSQSLSEARRKRKKPAGLASAEAIASYREVESRSGIHSASAPGILSLDIHSRDTNLILTGGADKTAKLFDRSKGEVVATFSGHTKSVSSVLLHPTSDIAVTGSADHTVRIWSTADESCKHVIKAHSKEVTGVTLQPSGQYIVSSGADSQWVFSDLETGSVYSSYRDPESIKGYTCTQFHPDGLILGTGTKQGIIRIWDVSQMSVVLNFNEHTAPVTSIAFSENGYYFASASLDNTVKLWDLRSETRESISTLNFASPVNQVAFDVSGVYLATAGDDVQVYLAKQMKQVAAFTQATASSTSVKFGPNASFLASAGLDRHLRFYSS